MTNEPADLGVSTQAPPSLELRSVVRARSQEVPLAEITVSFSARRLHAILGDSDSGKHALFRILGLLEPPDAGEVFLSGVAASGLRGESHADFRARRFGFVFAAPFLLASFSVVENVAMPLFKIFHVSSEEARSRTEALLAFVGLDGVAEKPAGELSHEAQYRAALARGMIHEPEILLVEELDHTLCGDDLVRFTDLLRRTADERGLTVIATASPALPCNPADRTVALVSGRIQWDSELVPEPGA